MRRMAICETCDVSFEPKIQTSGRWCSAGCFWTRGPDGPRKGSVKTPRQRTAWGHPLAGRGGRAAVSRLDLYAEIGPGPHPCHWCGRMLQWTVGIASDSIIVDHLDWNPINDELENLVVSCNSCNTRRAAPGRQGAIATDEPTVPIGKTHRTRAIECTCKTCGKSFLTPKSRPGHYCSRPCYYKGQIGRSHPQAFGRKRSDD